MFFKLSIRPDKPCYVEDDNLSQVSLAPHPSIRARCFPYQFWVSRLWGLPIVSSWRRRQARLCGTLGDPIYERYSPAVTRSRVPKLIASLGAITTAVAGCASMDFPLLLLAAVVWVGLLFYFLTPSFDGIRINAVAVEGIFEFSDPRD